MGPMAKYDPEITHVPVGGVVINHLKPGELDAIETAGKDAFERGGVSNLYLILACALIPTGLGICASLACTDIPDPVPLRFIVLMIVVSTTLTAGIVTALLWSRTRGDRTLGKFKSIIQKVRTREDRGAGKQEGPEEATPVEENGTD